MTPQNTEMIAGLCCHRCGYDLRAHSPDGKCPECGVPVAESRQVAALPRRPAWADSDPRWRWRMVAGTWILLLMLLVEAVLANGWAAEISVPAAFEQCMSRPLSQTLFSWKEVYRPFIFCAGVVLLFSKERGRRRGRLDWARRWGVICSYVVVLLSVVEILIVSAWVLNGIAALFLTIPPNYQPKATQLIIRVSTAYLRYGPYPKSITGIVVAANSSIIVLLACVPFFDALRSSGRKWMAAALVTPLALFAVMHLAQAAWYCLDDSDVTYNDVDSHSVYFQPDALARCIATDPDYLLWHRRESSLCSVAFVMVCCLSRNWRG